MKLEGLAQVVFDLLDGPVSEHELELVTVETAGGKGNPIIRVFLDTTQGGITLEQVAEATQWISTLLDEADPIESSYTLEVSSPGIDRPLCKIEDFARFTGEKVKIKMMPGAEKSSYTGVLMGAHGDDVVIACDGGEEVELAFGDIKKANVVGRIDFSKKEGEAL